MSCEIVDKWWLSDIGAWDYMKHTASPISLNVRKTRGGVWPKKELTECCLVISKNPNSYYRSDVPHWVKRDKIKPYESEVPWLVKPEKIHSPKGILEGLT